MRIVIRTGDRRLWIPIPTGLACTAVLLIPQSVLSKWNKSLPPPWDGLITRHFLRTLCVSLRKTLKGYKGLEIVRVESKDGTFVSIRL